MIEFDIHGVPHRITADKHQWILSRGALNKKTGVMEFKGFSFHTSARTLAEKLGRMEADGAADDLLAGLGRMEATLAQLLTRIPIK